MQKEEDTNTGGNKRANQKKRKFDFQKTDGQSQETLFRNFWTQ